ncbi:hypothetical protein O9993_21245 [Vibrio lentus]|nr:hypothetical protein [Vibrio lentus]
MKETCNSADKFFNALEEDMGYGLLIPMAIIARYVVVQKRGGWLVVCCWFDDANGVIHQALWRKQSLNR